MNLTQKAGASSTHSKRCRAVSTFQRLAKRLECVRLAGAFGSWSRWAVVKPWRLSRDNHSTPPASLLSSFARGVSSQAVKAKWNIWLPVILMIVFALTRWPGLMPQNFSAAYALAFCAGVFFPQRLAWWLPLATLLVTDLAINLYYQFYLHVDAFKATMLVNYAAYASIIWLGRKFGAKASWLKLLNGGILGAILFYLITNTAAWLFNPFQNPEYTRNLAGWIIALTKGTGGYPQTWEFFRNTLFSGGLFTGLFAGAMKLSDAAESAQEKEPEAKPAEEEPATGGAESKA